MVLVHHVLRDAGVDVARAHGMSAEQARGRAELLKRAIFRSEQLADFACRPLLLTLMASLHAYRRGSLPEKRGELYRDATELLLDWWERGKIVTNAAGQKTLEQAEPDGNAENRQG